MVCPVAAQGSGGSESGVVLSQGVITAGGRSLTALDNLVLSGAGQFGTGPPSVSANFTVVPGVLWTRPEVLTRTPMVFGTAPALGENGGGESITVFGYNFTVAGAGPPSVAFESGPGSGTTVVSNTLLTTVAPAGVGTLGNALPLSKIQVTTNHGTDSAAGAYVYTPALVQTTPFAHLGKTVKLRVFDAPGAFYVLAFGGIVDGVGIPGAPFGYTGSLELVVNPKLFGSIAPLPLGQVALDLPLLDVPALIGISVHFQALVFDDVSLTTGGFTNVSSVLFLP